jgi:hypothetical protein
MEMNETLLARLLVGADNLQTRKQPAQNGFWTSALAWSEYRDQPLHEARAENRDLNPCYGTGPKRAIERKTVQGEHSAAPTHKCGTTSEQEPWIRAWILAWGQRPALGDKCLPHAKENSWEKSRSDRGKLEEDTKLTPKISDLEDAKQDSYNNTDHHPLSLIWLLE